MWGVESDIPYMQGLICYPEQINIFKMHPYMHAGRNIGMNYTNSNFIRGSLPAQS